MYTSWIPASPSWEESLEDAPPSAACAGRGVCRPACRVHSVRGLLASKRVGTPLSAMGELEGSTRHLVVTTMQGDTFSEVLVDATTGKVATVEAITNGEVLTAAIAQRAVMVKARTSLRAVVESVLTAPLGFRALRVVPTLQGAQPVAEVILVKHGTVTRVVEPLD
jgi:hypothetical protein